MCLTQSHSINKQPSPSLHYLMRENKATFMVILTHRWHHKKIQTVYRTVSRTKAMGLEKLSDFIITN